MTISTPRRSRATALFGAAALVAGSVALIATPALADPGDGGTGTVTVHKLEQPSGSIGANDGSEINTSGATPLVAGFTTCAIDGVDLASSADWSRLKDISATINGSGSLVVTENGSPLSVTCGPEQLTDLALGGATEFTLPADQAYVVYESTPAANAVAAAQPTLITVPYPGNGDAGQPTWNYAPHIYPKNVIVGSGATKDGKIVGDQVTFNVNVPIMPLDAGSTYDELRINDQLAASLEYTGGSVALTNSAGADVVLDPADFTLTAPDGTTGIEVILNLTASGLAKVDANIGGMLTLTIHADAVASGNTANEAKITVNGTTTDKGPENPDVVDYFSGAHIVKEAKNKGAAANVPLAGAGFDVYTLAQTETACPATPDASAAQVFSDQMSGADGKTPNQVLAAGKYCVYESTIPAGYKGLNGGMLLDVTGADDSVTVVNTQVGADTGDLPSLPVTGSTGSMLMFAGGGALLLVGITLLVARRRQQH